MNIKKKFTVVAWTIFILAISVWLGLIIEFSLNVDSEKTAFEKQFILAFGGIVLAIVVAAIIAFRGKKK